MTYSRGTTATTTTSNSCNKSSRTAAALIPQNLGLMSAQNAQLKWWSKFGSAASPRQRKNWPCSRKEVSNQSWRHTTSLCLAPSAAHPVKHHPSTLLTSLIYTVLRLQEHCDPAKREGGPIHANHGPKVRESAYEVLHAKPSRSEQPRQLLLDRGQEDRRIASHHVIRMLPWWKLDDFVENHLGRSNYRLSLEWDQRRGAKFSELKRARELLRRHQSQGVRSGARKHDRNGSGSKATS